MRTNKEYVYHALFFKKPHERKEWLANQLPEGTDVEELMDTYTFPKIYREDIATYAVLSNEDPDKPIQVFPTRKEAWDFAQSLLDMDDEIQSLLIVDVPNSESDHPHYHNYYSERVIREEVNDIDETYTRTCTLDDERDVVVHLDFQG